MEKGIFKFKEKESKNIDMINGGIDIVFPGVIFTNRFDGDRTNNDKIKRIKKKK